MVLQKRQVLQNPENRRNEREGVRTILGINTSPPDNILKQSKYSIALSCNVMINAFSNSITLQGRSIDGTETEGASSRYKVAICSMITNALGSKKNLKRFAIMNCSDSIVSNAITSATNGGRTLDILLLKSGTLNAAASAIRDAMVNVKRLGIEDVPIDISVAKSLSEG